MAKRKSLPTVTKGATSHPSSKLQKTVKDPAEGRAGKTSPLLSRPVTMDTAGRSRLEGAAMRESEGGGASIACVKLASPPPGGEREPQSSGHSSVHSRPLSSWGCHLQAQPLPWLTCRRFSEREMKTGPCPRGVLDRDRQLGRWSITSGSVGPRQVQALGVCTRWGGAGHEDSLSLVGEQRPGAYAGGHCVACSG